MDARQKAGLRVRARQRHHSKSDLPSVVCVQENDIAGACVTPCHAADGPASYHGPGSGSSSLCFPLPALGGERCEPSWRPCSRAQGLAHAPECAAATRRSVRGSAGGDVEAGALGAEQRGCVDRGGSLAAAGGRRRSGGGHDSDLHRPLSPVAVRLMRQPVSAVPWQSHGGARCACGGGKTREKKKPENTANWVGFADFCA